MVDLAYTDLSPLCIGHENEKSTQSSFDSYSTSQSQCCVSRRDIYVARSTRASAGLLNSAIRSLSPHNYVISARVDQLGGSKQFDC